VGVRNLRLGRINKDLVFLVDGSDVKGGSLVPLPKTNQNLKKVLTAAFPDAKNSTFAGSDRTLTTGFVGIVFMLHVCDEVILYEMVPSTLDSKGAPWHYYERGGTAQSNPWHNSLPYEAAFWRAMAVEDTAHTGKLVLNGFSRQTQLCQSVAMDESSGSWASWGYRTNGHETNPVADMWVPPPGG